MLAVPLLLLICIRLSQASLLIPIIWGVKNYQRLTVPFKLLVYFLATSVVSEVQSYVSTRLYHNNLPGLHLFTLIEFLTFSAMFWWFFQREKKWSPLILINIGFFLIVIVAEVFSYGIWKPNTYARSYASISILSYTLIYFYFMFRGDDRIYTIESPMFWVSTGALLYFGSNSLYFLLYADLITKGATASLIGGGVHAILNIIAYCLYAQSFRCFNQKTV